MLVQFGGSHERRLVWEGCHDPLLGRCRLDRHRVLGIWGWIFRAMLPDAKLTPLNPKP